MTRAPILFAIVAALLLVSPVRAQTSPEDRAAADALYEQAGVLIKAERFAEACPKLETSQRLDPGIGTLLRLGYCYERVGRTASSWSAYNDAEGLARKANDKRAEDAAGRAKALEPKLSRLVITPRSPAAGQEVRRDGKPVDAGLWGTAVPVDPGEHALEVSAPGRRTWTSKVRIAGPGSTAVEVPQLVEGPADPSTVPYWSARRTSGVVLGSIGIGGVIAGAVLGGAALSKNANSKANCSPADPNFCNDVGASLRGEAISFGNGSTAAIAIGGALLTTGIVLFATAPSGMKTDAAQIEVVPGASSFAFRGRF